MPDASLPTVTEASLARDLRELGIHEGAVALVHSSLSGIGYVEGGAEAVIDALLEAAGTTGTVLFPTLTGTERDGPDMPPVVDIERSPCWTGRIPETARHRRRARRSLHPTHSVTTIGAAAKRYAAGHEASETPCDRHSPYHRLIEEDGSILLLGGVTQQSNTTLHCLEEIAGVPYHLQPEPTDGVVVDAAGHRHVVRNRLHQWGWERDFKKLDNRLLETGAMRCAPAGASTSCLISARGLGDIVLPLLQEDPLYLLTDRARAAFPAARLA